MTSRYEWIKQSFYRVSVKGILRDESWRFALCMKEMEVNGEIQKKWDIPGWGIDHGENPLDALEREFIEETWLVITKIDHRPKYFFIWESACTQKPLWLLYFEIEVDDLESLTHSKECSELRFFTLEEAFQEELYPAVRANLEEAKEVFWSF